MAVKWTRHRTIIPKSSVVSRSSSPHVSPARCHHRRRHHYAAGHRMEGERGGIPHGTRRAQARHAFRCQPAACEDRRRSLPSVQPAGNPAGRAAGETSGTRQPVAAHRGARGLGTIRMRTLPTVAGRSGNDQRRHGPGRVLLSPRASNPTVALGAALARHVVSAANPGVGFGGGLRLSWPHQHHRQCLRFRRQCHRSRVGTRPARRL